MDRFPVLYTNQLELRQINAGDIPSLVKLANNKRIASQESGSSGQAVALFELHTPAMM